MPVSDYHQVSDIMGEIQRISPKSVLDLGVGFGLYGVICRQLLDGQYGRCRRATWESRIYGVEAWERYQNPAWNAYTSVRLGLIRPTSCGFDLILMIDSLEHFTPEVGRPLLRESVANNKHVIVSVPNGPMEQGETFGNPHEAHLWTFNGTEEFEAYNFKLIHQSVCTVVSIEGVK